MGEGQGCLGTTGLEAWQMIRLYTTFTNCLLYVGSSTKKFVHLRVGDCELKRFGGGNLYHNGLGTIDVR